MLDQLDDKTFAIICNKVALSLEGTDHCHNFEWLKARDFIIAQIDSLKKDMNPRAPVWRAEISASGGILNILERV